jgi:tRNA dimethylallyltransferase
MRCICLTAPTASGKTALSLWLAERLPIEIVSMDSAMVYRGMDIGTAKPTRAEREAVAHHLIDVADPAEKYSAGRFLNETRDAIERIGARGKLALVVGGTMMYLRALRRGFSQLPPADDRVRADIDDAALAHGWPKLHEQLKGIDAQAAARIDPQDRQRIQRALEVHRTTGQTLTELQRQPIVAPLDDIVTVALVPNDRAALRERIARRFEGMLAAGFVEEVAALHARGDLAADLPAIRAVGYRQLWAHLDGALSLAEARQRAVTATRQLAKRQLTWLRSDAPDIRIASESPRVREEALRAVADVIERWS